MVMLARASSEEPELEILEPVDGAEVRLAEGDNAMMRFGLNFLSGRCMLCGPAACSGAMRSNHRALGGSPLGV